MFPVIQAIEGIMRENSLFENIKVKFKHPKKFKLPMTELCVKSQMNRMKRELDAT